MEEGLAKAAEENEEASAAAGIVGMRTAPDENDDRCRLGSWRAAVPEDALPVPKVALPVPTGSAEEVAAKVMPEAVEYWSN